MKIATGKEERPPELDTFAARSLSLAKIKEMVADQETLALLKRFSGNPDAEKAKQQSAG
jgi:hypothetical protein